MDATILRPTRNELIESLRRLPEEVKRREIDPYLLPLTDDFRAFVHAARPRYVWYDHCAALADVLERVADGSLRRLMVFMPPRHGKSEEVSRLFSAYYLHRHPERWVGVNSYAAELAYTLSRASRENYTNAGGRVRSDAAAVKHWETTAGGGLWAAGVGGPITGKGFHLGIIDDPLKNAEEASSELLREKQKDWYRSTFYTREEPGGAIILIQTRWHEDDLAGWLLSEETGEEPEGWHIIRFAARAEDGFPVPASCSLEPDERERGAPLCPERYPLAKLAKIEERIGGYYWGALYQQRPVPREGDFFKAAYLQVVDAAPAEFSAGPVRAWDLAATAGGGDYTASVKMAKGTDGLFYVLDVTRGRLGSAERNAQMRQTTAADGRDVRIRLAQDPGQAGKEQASQFTSMLGGYVVDTVQVTGPKTTRADPFSSQVNAGNVRLVRGAWNPAFIEELRGFPFGSHDDQVDAAADAFAEVSKEREFWAVVI